MRTPLAPQRASPSTGRNGKRFGVQPIAWPREGPSTGPMVAGRCAGESEESRRPARERRQKPQKPQTPPISPKARREEECGSNRLPGSRPQTKNANRLAPKTRSSTSGCCTAVRPHMAQLKPQPSEQPAPVSRGALAQSTVGTRNLSDGSLARLGLIFWMAECVEGSPKKAATLT